MNLFITCCCLYPTTLLWAWDLALVHDFLKCLLQRVTRFTEDLTGSLHHRNHTTSNRVLDIPSPTQFPLPPPQPLFSLLTAPLAVSYPHTILLDAFHFSPLLLLPLISIPFQINSFSSSLDSWKTTSSGSHLIPK